VPPGGSASPLRYGEGLGRLEHSEFHASGWGGGGFGVRGCRDEGERLLPLAVPVLGLPAEWKAYEDARTGRLFYWNNHTCATSWNPPEI
jgi:hypothetical protein